MNTSCLPLLSTKSPKTGSKKLPFTSSERELIVALVRDRPIIEDKRTHAQNIELKKKAWDELTLSYNAQSYVTPRNKIQLKRCWENIKSSRKKELSFESINMRRTGGGPPEGGPGLSSDNVVDAICPFINLTVPGVIDSNSIEISDDLTQTEEDIKKIKKNNVVDLEVVSDKPVYHNINTKIVTNFYDSENRAEGTEVINVDNNFISDVGNNVPSQPKKQKEISTNNTGLKKICSETEARIKRCTMNMQQDSELHELRLNRERILLKREENFIDFEKQLHDLQLIKIKMEIEVLKKQLQN